MPTKQKGAALFAGTLEEARRLPAEEIARAFSQGLLPPDVKAAAKFKALLLKQAESIKPGSSKVIDADTPFGRVPLEIEHAKDGRYYLRQA